MVFLVTICYNNNIVVIIMRKEFKNICKNSNLIGAKMVVVDDKKIIKKFSYGYRDLALKSKVTLNTKFRIASISKIIVAMCVMQLVEKNLFSIEDDISEILGFKIRNPKYPMDKITIKHLMTQTSSITDGFDDENIDNEGLKAGYNGVNGTNVVASLKELLVKNDGPYWIEKTFSNYRPGENFIYSNFGCGILACIVEKTTKQLFCDYVIDNIFSIMKLDAGFRIQDIKDKSDFSTLYYVSNLGNTIVESLNVKKLYDKTYDNFRLGENYRGPAGGLIISIKDLSKIMQIFLNDGTYGNTNILKKETVDLMQQFQWINSELSDYKAKGLQLKIHSKLGKEILRGHTGDAYGLVSFFFYNPEQKLGVCFLTNGGCFKKSPYGIVDIFEKLLEEVFQKYWNYDKKKTFVVHKEGLHFKLNDRFIKVSRPAFYNDGTMYISLLAVLDGLDIMPIIDNGLITIEKNNKKLSLKFEDFVKLDDECYVPLKDILNSLDLDFSESDEVIEIKYYN